jgi:hypothetical protein
MKIDLKTLNKKQILKDIVLFRISLSKLKKLYKLYKIYDDIEDNGFKLKYIRDINIDNIKLIIHFYNKYTTGEKLSFENMLKDFNEKLTKINEFTATHTEVIATIKSIRNILSTLK